jgi:DNA polymerase/3'-5' exonuclease PolX
MSQGKRRYPLAQAQTLAESFAAMLGEHVERVAIAGSVRRKREDVGDLEIICLTKPYPSQPAMFDEASGDRTILDELLAQRTPLVAAGWQLGAKNGTLYKQFTHITSGLNADVYVVPDERAWGSSLVVRTGPWYFARSLMQRAIKLGMRFSDGFLLHNHLHVCTKGAGCPDIIPLLTEREVFDRLRIEWMEPAVRDAGLRAKD